VLDKNKTNNHPVLYHYCPSSSFYNIIESKAIFLSPLTLSNDKAEGKLIKDIFITMLKKDSFLENKTILLDLFSSLIDEIEGFGLCFSEKKDLLSQWRGYAEDASGVSIGFSKQYLDLLIKRNTDNNKSLHLQKVIYNRSAQFDLVKPIYDKVRPYIEKGAFSFPIGNTLLSHLTGKKIQGKNKKLFDLTLKAFSEMVPLFFHLFTLKNRAFREEQEWRLIVHFLKGDIRSFFRFAKGKIVPYIYIPLSNLEEQPLVEIILGAKNKSPEWVVKSFLENNEFKNVAVKKSKIPYR